LQAGSGWGAAPQWRGCRENRHFAAIRAVRRERERAMPVAAFELDEQT